MPEQPNIDSGSRTGITWRMSGGSGDGSITTGQNFAKALMRSGLHIFTHQHYTSRIRGGHIHVEVRAASHRVTSRGDGFDFLVALGDSFARNPDDDAYYGNEELKPLTENLDDLREGSVIVYDTGLLDTDEIPGFDQRAAENGWHVYGLDLRGTAREHGRDVMRNTAGVGATAALLDMDPTHVEGVMRDSMSGDVLDANLAVLQDAYERVSEEYGPEHSQLLPGNSHDSTQAFLSGSAAVAYGALDSGCRFISGYPMTPWTDVFTIMSQNLSKFGGIAEQVEDEIAAGALALGASHTGVKAMSGSSGGGFALMSEPLGLAEMTETPVVLVEAMRGGPSTGMPTKPEQADLEHVLYTSQGDSCRVVFAPGNLREAYEQTRKAFEVAYEYHLPAIVLIDQKLSAEFRTVPADFFDRDPDPDPGSVLSESEIAELAGEYADRFERYRHDSETGVSPRPLPGQKGGSYLATGNEHNEVGHISEDPDNRVAQMERRMEKLVSIREELDDTADSHQTYYGPENATYGIVTWGSQQGTVREAVDRLQERRYSVRGLGVSDLLPFPAAEMSQFLESVEGALVVEMNYSGQFRGLVQRELGSHGDDMTSLLKFDGNPFEPAEIVDGFETTVGDSDDLRTDRLRLDPAVGD